MQVVRTKQKIRDFVFNFTPPKGSLAQLTLALANNTVEVGMPRCSILAVPLSTFGTCLRFHTTFFSARVELVLTSQVSVLWSWLDLGFRVVAQQPCISISPPAWASRPARGRCCKPLFLADIHMKSIYLVGLPSCRCGT